MIESAFGGRARGKENGQGPRSSGYWETDWTRQKKPKEHLKRIPSQTQRGIKQRGLTLGPLKLSHPRQLSATINSITLEDKRGHGDTPSHTRGKSKLDGSPVSQEKLIRWSSPPGQQPASIITLKAARKAETY
ncbi:unnamed protein product [Pleuronectes platessa]|uniref:Uncharacterized protein n=1 Tax=Pleuronectes platessa TaxID=8262 RepID=A0A9N7U209_PLEPL|nr:unnamed protein product [Pleuronectes platessa]